MHWLYTMSVWKGTFLPWGLPAMPFHNCLWLGLKSSQSFLVMVLRPWWPPLECMTLFFSDSSLYSCLRLTRDICTPVFIVALLIIARTWKQPRCPLADEWIRELWCIYTMGYYSATKKNAFASVLLRWMKLEPIIQREVSQKEKHQYSILTHIYGILKDGNNDPMCETAKETQI